MNHNLDIQKVLEALQHNLDIAHQQEVYAIIQLLEYHGFARELVFHITGDMYLAQLQYKKAIEMYESAIQLYKKQNRTEESRLLENHITYIRNTMPE